MIKLNKVVLNEKTWKRKRVGYALNKLFNIRWR